MWRALFNQYRRLPRKMPLAYARRLPDCVDIDDLEQWGLIGLMQAAKRFDPNRDVKFATYAGRRIHGAMVDGIREMDWAPRLSRKRGEKITTVQSLECPIEEDDGNVVRLEDAIEDQHTPPPGAELAEADSVARILRPLPRRLRWVMRSYFVAGHTIGEVGQSLGLSASRISQMLQQARRILLAKGQLPHGS